MSLSLFEKIKKIYPQLKNEDFLPWLGSITLQNDGNGDYIKEWKHPTLSQPTQEQLDAVTE
jgi:hypothetical protein